jgi:hypothetical protein
MQYAASLPVSCRITAFGPCSGSSGTIAATQGSARPVAGSLNAAISANMPAAAPASAAPVIRARGTSSAQRLRMRGGSITMHFRRVASMW